jgi:hypothetical protein
MSDSNSVTRILTVGTSLSLQTERGNLCSHAWPAKGVIASGAKQSRFGRYFPSGTLNFASRNNALGAVIPSAAKQSLNGSRIAAAGKTRDCHVASLLAMTGWGCHTERSEASSQLFADCPGLAAPQSLIYTT